MIEQKLSLELSKNGIQKTVYTKAGNNLSLRIIINFACHSKVLDVSSEDYDVFVYCKPAEEVLDYSEYLAKEGTGVVFSPPALTAGERIFELKIVKGNEILYAPQFSLYSEASLDDGAWVEPGKPVIYQPDTDSLVETYYVDDDTYVPVRKTANRKTKLSVIWQWIKNKLAAVAVSGSYDDLDDSPDIPSKTSDLINDGDDGEPFITENDLPETLPNPHKLTINGTEYDGSSEVSVTVQGGGDAPVRTSELENDGEDGEHPFITAEELSEAVSVKETSMEARIAAAELAGHHAENVPIVVLDDWSRMLAFAFDNDYQHAHNDVLPNGSRLLKCVISDGTNSSELNEIPFCDGTNLLVDSNFIKIVGFAVYDDNGLFSYQTWLGQDYNMGIEEFTAEIWWEE